MSDSCVQPPPTTRRRSTRFVVVLTLVASAAQSIWAQGAAAPQVVLTLGQAARLGAQQGAVAVDARFRADEFTARALESRSLLLPNLTASMADGERTYNTASFGLPFPGFNPNGQIIGPVRTVDVRARVVANLFDPAGLRRYRGAQAAVLGADADVAAAAEQAATAAAVAYVRALRAEAQVAARAADSALAAELLDIARSQLTAGVGVRLDVTRAEAQVAGVRAQLIASRHERDRSRLDLLRAAGLPLTTPVVLGDSLAAPASVDTTPAVEAALDAARRTRPDLRAAAAGVQTARLAVNAVRAERLPTVGVFADNGMTSNGYSHLLNTYTYGVQLSVPVFQGSRVMARVQAQTAGLHRAEARVRDLEAQVEADVRGAILDLNAARDQVGAVRDRLRLADEELSLARERFRAGVVGNADVIAAQLNMDVARSQFVDALTAFHSARVSLARATGRVTSLP